MRIRPEIKITVLYLTFGVLWILLSDKITHSLTPELHKWLQTVKGLLFVGITAFLLYLLTYRYYKELNMRIRRLEKHEAELEKSERRYKLLFDSGPNPKWIFDIETLQILYVNYPAIEQYGYSRQQFLDMTIRDIMPAEDIDPLKEALKNTAQNTGNSFQGNFRHIKANGEIILVDIYSHTIEYKGRPAKIINANDVTERVMYIRAIETQNKKLQDISWIQSHVVRSPLASLMGCANLLQETRNNPEDHEVLLAGLMDSATKLDGVIQQISKHSEVVMPMNNQQPDLTE